MGKKKPFINKKTAQHFHVVHRSQRDPKINDPEASPYVLLSSSTTNKSMEQYGEDEDEDDDASDVEDDSSDDELPDLVTKPSRGSTNTTSSSTTTTRRRVRFGNVEAEDLVDANGMLRDGYDYSQHLKEMGHGTFYSSEGRFDSTPLSSALTKRVDLPDEVLPSQVETDRLLEAITLTTNVMDEDLAEALVNDTAFEELDDDFVTQAAQDVADQNDGFDYDAHIAKLMEAASGIHPYEEEDEDDVLEDDDDDDDVHNHNDHDDGHELDRKLLDEMFEKTYREEYDDDMVGELDDDDIAASQVNGGIQLEGALLDAIVEDFKHIRQEMLDDEGKLGNPLRTGNHLQQIREECEQAAGDDDNDDDHDDDNANANATDELARAREQALCEQFEAMMARNEYLAPRVQEQWDCESIVSTYSTLDNHPTLLCEPRGSSAKKNKNNKNQSLEKDPAACGQIRLSRKTGMPLHVLPSPSPSPSTNPSRTKTTKSKQPETSNALHEITNNLPLKRDKQEPKEVKKLRKEQVKWQKQMRRMAKKQTKTAFREEEQRQVAVATACSKVAVFKY